MNCAATRACTRRVSIDYTPRCFVSRNNSRKNEGVHCALGRFSGLLSVLRCPALQAWSSFRSDIDADGLVKHADQGRIDVLPIPPHEHEPKKFCFGEVLHNGRSQILAIFSPVGPLCSRKGRFRRLFRELERTFRTVSVEHLDQRCDSLRIPHLLDMERAQRVRSDDSLVPCKLLPAVLADSLTGTFTNLPSIFFGTIPGFVSLSAMNRINFTIAPTTSFALVLHSSHTRNGAVFMCS